MLSIVLAGIGIHTRRLERRLMVLYTVCGLDGRRIGSPESTRKHSAGSMSHRRRRAGVSLGGGISVINAIGKAHLLIVVYDP
jgi:hypothetical protein